MTKMRKFIPVLLILAPMAMLYPLWVRPLCAGEDDVLYYYPLRKMVGESLSLGRLPVSDPLTACGTPLLGDPQSAVFFPTTWLFAIVGAKPAYSLSIFAAFGVAGVGMWVYLRRLGLVAPAAVFGALAFEFCGFFIGHRVHLGMIQTAAMLPWGLYCIELLRTRPRAALAGMVPVFSLAIFAGHWAMLVHLSLIWGAYLLFRARRRLGTLGVLVIVALLVTCITAPQLYATMTLMGEVTRGRIDYITAGENSFFPTAAALMLFPMLMGSRWPGFYPQQWWGAWHHCEMLGYVGLVTLVIAVAVVWKIYRKKKTGCDPPFQPVVRVWTWIALGAAVFMLGYYLPTYYLVYMLPVLGLVRCPARMILAVDCAVAVLAAVGVHVILTGGGGAEALRRAVARGVVRKLPAVMLAVLFVLAVAAAVAAIIWPAALPLPFNGSPGDALRAVLPWNPGVLVPLLTAVVTAIVILAWVKSPRRRWGLLIVLLAADLFFVARFVDIPPGGSGGADPENSPAARWLHENASKDEPYRVWGLGDPYGRRQGELLLARTNTVHDIATISTYGPLLSPEYERLFGFRIFGTNSEWRRLIRTNHLLSRYNVRYILAERDSEFEKVIASARGSRGDSSTEVIYIYKKLVELPAINPSDPPICIYENVFLVSAGETSEGLVRLSPAELDDWKRRMPPGARPDVRIRTDMKYSPAELLWKATLPAAMVYLLFLAGEIFFARRRVKKG